MENPQQKDLFGTDGIANFLNDIILSRQPLRIFNRQNIHWSFVYAENAESHSK